MKYIGTHFVGQMLFKITILGTVKFVANVETGIAMTAIIALMALAA
jgi:hypothetical protein